MEGKCGEVQSAAPASTEGTKKCLRTRKIISLSCFDANPKTGNPMSNCVLCTAKNRIQHTAYNATANGKAKNQIRNARTEIKKAKQTWKDSDAGKEYTAQYTRTAEYAERGAKFAKSSAGKAVRKRTYEKHHLSTNLMNGVARILRGGTSPSTLTCIAFGTEFQVRAHFTSPEFPLQSYGKTWSVDHKIPKSAYDHDDPQEVKKCWSPENMRALSAVENKEKSTFIIRSVVETVPVSFWPKEWNGVIVGARV